jgi:hypothetical protein
METDRVAQADFGAVPQVMAAVEGGEVDTLVLADVSRDEAYLTVSLTEAATLSDWR